MTSHLQRIGCQGWVTFDDPLEALELWCVRDRVAADVVDKYPIRRILWQLVWLPYRVAKNPSGLLVKAIVGNFPRPGLPAEEVDFVEQQLNQGKFPLPSLEAIRASDASFEKWKELRILCEQVMSRPNGAPSCDDPTCEGCDVF